MRKSTPIQLSADQPQRLEQFITSGRVLARHVQHANVILKLAEGWSYPQIAAAFNLSERTLIRLKRRFETEGLDSVLKDKPRTGAPPRIDGTLKSKRWWSLRLVLRPPAVTLAGLCDCWPTEWWN